jgi:hypothetical protein
VAIRESVLFRVADASCFAVSQVQAARSLDLEKSDIHRVFKPGQFQTPPVQGPALCDLLSRVVGDHVFPVDPCDNIFSFELLIEKRKVNLDQVVGFPVDGVLEGTVRPGPALKDRLEVSGEKHLPISACRLVNQELFPYSFVQLSWARSGSDHFKKSGLALHHLSARVPIGTINILAFRTLPGEILEIPFNSFPQGIQIHVVFEGGIKPAHGNECLLRPLSFFDQRRMACGEERQSQ